MMQKLPMILFSALLFVVLALGGLFLFSFTEKGNRVLQPYVKEVLEEKIGLPVEVKSFKLEFGTVRLAFLVNKQALVQTASHYALWGLSFDGIYQITAKTFVYENVTLEEATLKGRFKGVRKEIAVSGKGSALGADMDYSFTVMDKVIKKLILHMKEADLAQILKLWGKPALAKGKLDVDVTMPEIGEDNAEGYGHILLHHASFDRVLMQKLYDVTLPENNELHVKAEAKLRGDLVRITGDLQSRLLNILLKDMTFNTDSRVLNGAYDLDVKEMRLLTKNRLSGAFRAKGKIKVDKGQKLVTGESTSLGGALRFTVDKGATMTLDRLSLQKILTLFKQPAYAKGQVNGTLVWDTLSKQSKAYDLHIRQGKFLPGMLDKKLNFKIPENNHFSFTSKGKISQQKLLANASLDSTLAAMTFSFFAYDLKHQTVNSDYAVTFHDIHAFLPKAKLKKGMKLGAKGHLQFKKTLTVSGETSGLGKKVTFLYDGKKAKVDAKQFFIEKLLALTGSPAYAKGTMNAKVVFTDTKASEGTFSLESTNLVLQPEAMKKWVGKAVKQKMKLESTGSFRKHRITMNTDMKMPFGKIVLRNMVYKSKMKSLKSRYTIDIPELKKMQVLTDKKLYGPLLLSGSFSKEKDFKLTGRTTSLGGKISYSLHGDEVRSTITDVPLLNIMGLLGHKKNFLGQAFGKGVYHLKQKSGVVDLDIRAFQIRPSPLTNTIKMFLGKDPARIIYSSTKFHADIKKKITRYTLMAKGSHSSLEIRNGRIDKLTDTHSANFIFVYESYTIHGKIKGKVGHPKVTIDTNTLLKEQLSNGKLGEKLEKVLGGKAGKFLKGLSF